MTEAYHRRLSVWICLGLAAAVAAVYWPVYRFEFINFDDQVYVTDNSYVRTGLTLENVLWAFTSLEAQFWHPLTWLSHMLDCELYGLKAGWHHVTNVLLHLANTLLLFVVLRRMTGALWRSGLVAALFGLHPLHVETVAWVADRKDVLSTLFWMLTLWAYSRYAEFRVSSCKFQVAAMKWYGMALVFYLLGLMSKPMLVTLPFVLLLLDCWPLRRFELTALNAQRSTLLRLIWEKVPFLVLTITASSVGFLVQKNAGGLSSLGKVSMVARVSNAFISYICYLQKMCWPSDLAAYYPHPGGSLWLAVGACLFLLIVTVLTACWICSQPWWGVGWFWYLGTLVPVIGLVQIGSHAMADRYTYVPLIGVFIMLVWGAGGLLARWRYRRASMILAGGLVVVGCMVSSSFQVKYWKNSETLFRHALAVTTDNHLAHGGLGAALLQAGNVPEAMEHLEQAVRLKPDDAVVHNNFAAALVQLCRTPEAIEHLVQALQIRPHYAEAHIQLGNILFQLGKLPESVAHYEQVLRFRPRDAVARMNLGVALIRLGKVADGIAQLAQVLQFNPDYADAHYNLGVALLQLGKVPEAIGHYEQAVRLKPEDPVARCKLAWVLATCGDGAVRDGTRAVVLAQEANRFAGGKDPGVLDTLAAAYAEAGRFGEAVRTAQAAVELVQQAGRGEQAGAIEKRLKLYAAGLSYHEEVAPGP